MKGCDQNDIFSQRPAVTINFSDITYEVLTWKRFRPERKKILHGVSGEFRSGQVSVVMGPSGAGKSTLLNILAGFRVRGSNGCVLVNGVKRGTKTGLEEFKKISCYIQQENLVRQFLKVREALMMAIQLKLGYVLTLSQKQNKIDELLLLLGLSTTEATYCKDLSGGQKKRLAIALELVTNPPIIFLDEPTTGLDCVSTTTCVQLLRKLAEQGRTIVCTLHQPSALLLTNFSQIYCVAEGNCIYQGPPADITNFFSGFDLICPKYHNPADFLIEVASGDYPRNIESLSKAASSKGQEMSSNHAKNIDENGIEIFEYSIIKSKKKAQSTNSDISTTKTCLPKPAPIWLQLFHLYNRNLMILRRDYHMVLSRIICHLVIGLIFGYLYKGVGNNANTLLANFIYLYGSNLFLHYTGQMTVLLSFPIEYEVLTREHFNRWYSLAPYCVALLLVEIPFQVACALAYLFPSYYLTEQPLELYPIGKFMCFNLAICLTAQATGFLSGALLPITLAVFMGPVLSVFFSVFGFTSKYSDIPFSFLRPLYNISYFRSAFQGSFLSVYGAREELPCYDYYCHYRHTKQFIVEWEFSNYQPIPELCYIILIGVAAYIATMLSVWVKLTRR